MAQVRKKSLIKVDNVWISNPSKMTINYQDVSSEDSGRTLDAQMHKNKIAEKVMINLSWSGTDKAVTKEVLQSFRPEYFMVEYDDPIEGIRVTKEFYCGDKSAPVLRVINGSSIFETVSFDIIER